MKTLETLYWIFLKIFVILICLYSSTYAQSRNIKKDGMFNPKDRFKWEKRMASASAGLLVISGASYLAYRNSMNNPAGANPNTVRNWQKAYQWSFYGSATLGVAALVMWQIKDKWLRPRKYGMNLKINENNCCKVEIYPVYNARGSGQIQVNLRF